MDSKATMLLVLASFLLITTRVSANIEELFAKDIDQKVSPAPIKAYSPPPPAPAVKTPPQPPPSPPVYKPVPVPPPVKQLPPPPSPLKAAPPTPPGKAPPPPSPIQPPPRNTKECYPLCWVRCKLHSRKNVCLRACVTCCDRCKCVPPGQYGNREKCGKCYVNMTTHGGKLKCP